MIKQATCAVLLAASVAGAHAATRTYDWSFSGFIDLEGGFPIDTVISGQLSVEDVNGDGDGAFSLNEVRSLLYKGIDFASCATCDIERFSWTPGSLPDFYIYDGRSYDWGRSNEWVDTGVNWSYGSQPNWGAEPFFKGGSWTVNTTGTITPVPEPRAWLMLAAGLALVGAMRRVRT